MLVGRCQILAALGMSGLCRSGSSLDLRQKEEGEEPAGPLRRVFTVHARRRSRKKKGFALSKVMKEPLRVVHSVPLGYSNGTSSNDLISRRGVFSRRHYGSVELLPQVEANGQDIIGRRFRVESGDSISGKEEMFGTPSTPVLENPEYQTRWYFKYFLGKLHQNYVGVDGEKVPFFLSVVLTEANTQCGPQYRVILWKKTGAQKISLSHTPNKPMTVKQILSNFPNMEKLEKGPKEIFSPDIQKDLLLLEEQEGSVNFKFGVLYTRPGQITDDEMFSNAFNKNMNFSWDKTNSNRRF